MTLIAILLILAIERFVGAVDHLRDFSWFQRYAHWLENRLLRHALWRGPLGVLIILVPPVLLLILVSWVLYTISPVLNFILACAVLLYTLGPKDLGHQVTRYTEALYAGDHDAARTALAGFHDPRNESRDFAGGRLGGILCSLFEQANVRLFAVLFWFVILGPIGALLYRLTAELQRSYAGVHGRFADTVSDLYDLLNWPTIRLQAMGYALTGSLVEALENWRQAEARRLDVNEEVLCACGLAALQFHRLHHAEAAASEQTAAGHEPSSETSAEETVDWIEMARGLENRTLIVWLIVLAIMTIAGWAS